MSATRVSAVLADRGGGALAHPLEWLRQRDRDLAALRRAGRAAIVMPAMFALGDQVIANPAVATFAAFGSFAMLLLLADFTGPLRERLQAQASLALAGFALVSLGTLVSRSVWLSVVTMAIVGFVLIFIGVVSSVLASATTSLLLAFILPVTLLNWLGALVAHGAPRAGDASANRAACAVKLAAATVLDRGAEMLATEGGDCAELHAAIDELGEAVTNVEREAAASAVGAAVLVANETGVQHSFWVVLGALSVLRSNALNTGQNVVRGMLGTVVGFVVAGALIELIGTNATLLWFLLPFAILLAGVAPAAISFAAGQAAFTLTLVFLYNIVLAARRRPGAAARARRRVQRERRVPRRRRRLRHAPLRRRRRGARRARQRGVARGRGGAPPRRHVPRLPGRARAEAGAAVGGHHAAQRGWRPADRRRRGARAVAARGRSLAWRPHGGAARAAEVERGGQRLVHGSRRQPAQRARAARAARSRRGRRRQARRGGSPRPRRAARRGGGDGSADDLDGRPSRCGAAAAADRDRAGAPGDERRRASMTMRVEGFDAVEIGGSSGELQATFVPAAGMACCSLRHRGAELLARRHGVRAYAERGSTMGIPLLYPWANRLAGFDYPTAHGGVTLSRESPLLTLDRHGLPIHGVLAGALPWELLEGGDGGDRLHARLQWQRAELLAIFPYEHELELRASMTGSSLLIETTVRAGAHGSVPVSFGFHPYFALPDADRSACEVELPLARRLLLDERMIPTGESEPFDRRRFALADRSWDDAFAELAEPPVFTLGAGSDAGSDARTIALDLRSGYSFAQLYAPAGESFACFEPMTAPANALRSGDGLQLVAPGREFDADGLQLVAPGREFDAAFSISVSGGGS